MEIRPTSTRLSLLNFFGPEVTPEKLARFVRWSYRPLRNDDVAPDRVPVSQRSLRDVFFGPNNERPPSMFPELLDMPPQIGPGFDVMSNWAGNTQVRLEVVTEFNDRSNQARSSIDAMHTVKIWVDLNGCPTSTFPKSLKDILCHTADHLVNIFLHELCANAGEDAPTRIFFGMRKSFLVYTLVGRSCCMTVRMSLRMHRYFPEDGSTTQGTIVGVLLAVHRHTGTHFSPFSDPLHQYGIKLRCMYEDRRAHRLAFAMGLHIRLGAQPPMCMLDEFIVETILRTVPLVDRVEFAAARDVVQQVFAPMSEHSLSSDDDESTSSVSTGSDDDGSTSEKQP